MFFFSTLLFVFPIKLMHIGPTLARLPQTLDTNPTTGVFKKFRLISKISYTFL